MTNQNISNSKQDTVNIREMLLRYLKQWYWFVLSVIVCIGLGVLVFISRTPVYNVSSTLLIRSTDENGMGQMPQVDMLSMMGLGATKQVTDELAIINSRYVMEQSIRDLGLQTEYRKKQKLRWVGQYPKQDVLVVYPQCFTDTMRKTVKMSLKCTSKGYVLKVKYGSWVSSKHKFTALSDTIGTCIGDISFHVNKMPEKGDKYRIVTMPLPVITDKYRLAVNAKQIKKESNVVRISTDTDMPQRAINLMNKMIDLYNYDAVIDKNIMATNTKNFIDERLKIITEELEAVETDVETYKKQKGITSLSDEAAIYLRGSNEYQRRQVEIETQQNILDFLRQFIADEQNKYNFIPANIGINSEVLLEVIGEYNELLLTRMKTMRSATADNPVLAHIDMQLQAMRQNIEMSIKSAEDGLEIMRKDLQKQEKRYAGRIGDVPTQEREYLQIKRQQEIKQNIYLFLYQKREENALTLASTVMPAKTIDVPQMMTDPVAPRLRLILLIALVLGILIPIGVIFVYDIFDNKIKDIKQYERLVKAPVLGQLIQSRKRSAVVITQTENTASAELFRLLRTNLRFMLPAENKSNVILITSSVNGEGKSFVAINTALSMALLGKRVVLVGLDIRKPTLASYIGLNSTGLLTAYLADSAYELDDIIVSSGLDNKLDVIPAGVVPPNPNELLQNERLDELFVQLRERYDYVFVDSAPVAMVSDTFLLNRVTDMTIYVSRADYTEVEMADYVNQVYEQKRLKNIACVLNGVKASAAGYGSTYGYGYGKSE
ncbi:MAG: polysaccharide biosynthesis tyrosine autokinase [Paludibacteraceae bacterium]|nr:polysaccharide biosynthesis tyrosine autokinase [Paludibacteraceae bacterium]